MVEGLNRNTTKEVLEKKFTQEEFWKEMDSRQAKGNMATFIYNKDGEPIEDFRGGASYGFVKEECFFPKMNFKASELTPGMKIIFKRKSREDMEHLPKEEEFSFIVEEDGSIKEFPSILIKGGEEFDPFKKEAKELTKDEFITSLGRLFNAGSGKGAGIGSSFTLVSPYDLDSKHFDWPSDSISFKENFSNLPDGKYTVRHHEGSDMSRKTKEEYKIIEISQGKVKVFHEYSEGGDKILKYF